MKSVNQFCGDYTLNIWSNDSFGLCGFELYILLPTLFVYLFVTVGYCFVFRKYLAFDTFQSNIFWFRLATSACTLCASLLGTILIYTLPFYSEAFSENVSFEVVHHTCIVFLWIVIVVYDFLHGKSHSHSSRGPILHLVVSLAYFYVSLGCTWSAYRQVNQVWRVWALTFRLIHLSFVALHLLSKVPIVYNMEEPRKRRARLARQAYREHSVIVDETEATETDSLLPPSSVQSNEISEDNGSFLSKLFFSWMNSTIQCGYFGELFNVFKLPNLPNRLSPVQLECTLPLYDEAPVVSSSSSWKIIRLLFRFFGREFMLLGFLKLLSNVTSLCAPVFLNRFILIMSDKEDILSNGIVWGTCLVVSSFISCLISTHYSYRMSTFGYKIRVSVSGMVYRSILSTRLASLNTIGSGSLVNYLTSDADRIVNFFPSLHELWAMPLQLILAIALLYIQLGVSCLVGVGFLLVLLPLNRLLATQIGKFSRRLMLYKDVRIKFMSETLSNVAAVKLACWESLIFNKISLSRSQELKALWGQKLLDAVCVFCWAACPALLASSTFATYVAIGNRLDASIVFTSLALFGMLIGPMNAFPWVINGVMEAVVSIQRISTLLYLPRGPFPSLSNDNDSQPVSLSTTPIHMIDACFYWSEPSNPVLQSVTLCVKQGQMVGLLGPVGSGKSSFLLAVLGELKSSANVDQIISTTGMTYAYVAQTPWLLAGTIKDNIIFGSALDSEWLNQVIYACGLEPDVRNFPHGLDTDVGEGGGCRLSGGQRARVALARAVYQRADVYLLDDPVAALDMHVGAHVVKHCLKGLLSGKTRLITSHQASWLCDPQDDPADLIVYLRSGQIIDRISPTSDQVNQPDHKMNTVVDDNLADADAALLIPNDPVVSSNSVAYADQTEEDENQEAADWEHLAFGSINFDVYWSYLRAVGYCLSFGIILSLILMQGSRNAADWWLAHWVQFSTKPDQVISLSITNVSVVRIEPLLLSTLLHSSTARPWSNLTPSTILQNDEYFYLYVYGAIVGGHVVVTTLRAVLFAVGGLAAASTIHRNALYTILQARLSYFDSTPCGRILNRFSADVGTVDDGLPFILNILLANVAGLVGVLVIACFLLPFLLPVLLPLLFIFWSIQRNYRGAARDLKRISSVCRSPVYAHFSDTLAGLAVIRGLRQQMRFRQLTAEKLGIQLRSELASLAAGSWLSLRLQLIAVGIVAGVVALALVGRILGLTEVTAVGLAAAYALNIANLLTGTIYVATETEKSLIAVERCQELVDDTPIESDTVPIVVTAPQQPRHRRSITTFVFDLSNYPVLSALTDWPQSGRVEFQKVSLNYKRTLVSQAADRTVQALSSVSFVVEPGQHFGVVGRTGSGKSSLIRVLLRLVDHLPGPCTDQRIANQRGFVGASGLVLIDGIDIRTIPLRILRSRILAICQEPFLFSGCLRDNLDPTGDVSDSVLHDVLIKCQLAINADDASEWLERDVGEGGRSISAGQRQLICLARALLLHPRPRILCLDEATASVDMRCEEILHDLLHQEFQDTTVIMIAHRLTSVRRLCSKVLLMHHGEIIHQGEPELVLQRAQTLNDSSLSGKDDLIQF